MLKRARTVLEAESDAILGLIDRLDDSFVRAVQLMEGCRGRVVATGVGKAGIIAHKIAATLASTGTPAHFLHPSEAVHGDLGVVTPDDVVLALSNSGESDEVLRLLPSLSRIGTPIVALVGNALSTLGRSAAVTLDVHVAAEACPLGLAPTASAVAMLALGDALAMAVMEGRGFTHEDYARFHPAGSLGRRLTLRVSDVMRTGDQMAVIPKERSLLDAMFAINKAQAGAAFLVDSAGALVGLVTDGDIRRMISQNRGVLDEPCDRLVTNKPLVVIAGDPLAAEALQTLEDASRKVGEAPVVDSDGRPVGLIMLKDLLRAGIV